MYDRFEPHHANRHVRGIGGNAVLAGTQNRVNAIEAVQRRISRADACEGVVSECAGVSTEIELAVTWLHQLLFFLYLP